VLDSFIAYAKQFKGVVFTTHDELAGWWRPEEGLRLVLEQAKKEAKITRDIPLAEIINVNLLQEAQTELRPKK
jgi:hypothetical protein